MKVKTKYNAEHDIYGIYYGNIGIIFYGIYKGNYHGLSTLDPSKVEIMSSEISENFMFFKNDNLVGVFHSALIEEELLDDLIDADAMVYEKFLNILKEQKEIEPYF